jgi:hypothetical protein
MDATMRIFGGHRHRNARPWDGAPPWAVELREMLGLVLLSQGIIMSLEQDLLDEVQSETTVIGGVEVAIQNLIDAVAAAGNDRTKLQAALDAARANKSRIAALVAANTPAHAEAVASPAAPEVTG